MADERTTHEPHDRLTRIANRLGTALDTDPEYRPGDKAIVFMDDGHRGGIGIFNYDDQTEAITDLLLHLRALFRSTGKQLDFMFLDEHGATRIGEDR